MDERGSRMVSFGAIMIMLVGAFNVVDGIVAIANSSYFSGDILFSNLQTWGWFFTIFGVVQFLVGAAVYGGSHAARWLAIVIAGFNLLAQLSYVAHYPAWSIAIMVLDIVVIYALATYGTVLGQDTVADSNAGRAPRSSDVRAAGPRMT